MHLSAQSSPVSIENSLQLLLHALQSFLYELLPKVRSLSQALLELRLHLLLRVRPILIIRHHAQMNLRVEAVVERVQVQASPRELQHRAPHKQRTRET